MGTTRASVFLRLAGFSVNGVQRSHINEYLAAKRVFIGDALLSKHGVCLPILSVNFLWLVSIQPDYIYNGRFAKMPVIEQLGRRNSVPIIYVRGTHYEVGFEVGRTFRSMIQSYVNIHGPLNQIYLPIYETSDGKNAYNLTLAAVKKNYPQYIDEIQGTAEGANVPFHKLFLLHMDEILPCSVQKKSADSSTGCSTVGCNNPGQEILGHNEDALAETLNHFYLVSAHIVNDKPMGRWKVKEEKFTSLCYAGTLPGFTMNYNHDGFLYTVNVIRVKNMQAGKTPRTILTRALLAAENLSQVQDILVDQGTGIGDGMSLNMVFLKQEGTRLFYNAEAGPTEHPATDSVVDIIAASPGEHIYHCNRLLRLNTPESPGSLMDSSVRRHKAMETLPVPKCCADVFNLLGDQSDKEHPVFIDEGLVKTIATGIFNLDKMTWSIYTDNPKTHDPVAVLPIIIK